MPRFHASVVCCDGNGTPHQTCHTLPVGYFNTREEAMEAGAYAASRYNSVASHTHEFYAYRVRVVADNEW